MGLESRLHEEEEKDPPGAVGGAVGGAGISDQSRCFTTVLQLLLLLFVCYCLDNDIEIDENLFTGDIEVDESLFDVDELGLEEDDHSSNDDND